MGHHTYTLHTVLASDVPVKGIEKPVDKYKIINKKKKQLNNKGSAVFLKHILKYIMKDHGNVLQ